MSKKTIAVFLCLTLLICSVAVCMPVHAVTTADEGSVGYNRKNPVSSADDFTWDNANVYFLLTDRFYNGNTANDHSYGRATDANGNVISGWNTSPATFHGGDFAGITRKIEEGYFDNLGVNAIWLSAPYEQIHGYVTPGGNNDFAHYSYHGYYVLDYTETDANFGTKQEFQTLVDTAHKHGIRVVMDIVMNHAGYNTIKDMLEYNFGSFKDKAAATSYIYKLTGVNGLHDYVDYNNSASTWGRWWGSDWIRSGLPGYNEGNGGDEQSCLSGMPDFRTESQTRVSIPTFLQEKWQKEGTYNTKISKYGNSNTVTGYISSWLADWVETYGVDGFRCDTAKHVDKASWKTLKTRCVDALRKWRQNNPSKVGADWDEDFWMTGECWGYVEGYGSYYTDGGFDSMISFKYSGGSGVPGVGSIDGAYQSAAASINGGQANYNLLTYISSHDSNLARNNLIYQGSAFLLYPGGVQIYYGDESNRPIVSGIAFDGDGGSGHTLRGDMNFNLSGNDAAIRAHWQKVGQFRRNHVAVGAGSHQKVSASSGYAFSRSYDDGETTDGIIAVISANANTSVSVDVSSMWGNGTTVTNFYDGSTAVVSGGKVNFSTGANGTILIEGPQSSISMGLKGDYSFYDSETVTVSLRGADFAMVSVNGGSAFRVTNGQTFEIGEGIEAGTVIEVTMTAANASETLSKSFTFKKKDPNAVITIYFDDSRLNWGNIKAYIYDDSSDPVKNNSAWPGSAMQYDSKTGLYYLDVPDELVNGKVIFSGDRGRYPGDGAEGLAIKETSMIFKEGNSWKPYEGESVEPKPTEDPANTVTVYVNAASLGYSSPNIYYWSSATDSGPLSWPGTPMTKYKDNIFKATFPKEYDRCIFNQNGQTGDLIIPGNNYIYDNGAWTPYADAEQPATQAPQPTTVAPQPTTQPIHKVLVGDADQNGTVNVVDATEVQKHIVELVKLSSDALKAADANGDSLVNIKDVTAIQYYAAGNSMHAGNCGKMM
ncbi:MAG: starch-binding protein [Ruminococcus sp.]|nr:starch-binding protein [Ruminococcus sp.]